jgi:c-di-AMP phosphodiesterase-like protein
VGVAQHQLEEVDTLVVVVDTKKKTYMYNHEQIYDKINHKGKFKIRQK